MNQPLTKSSLKLADRLGICSWSLRPKSVEQLIAALREVGIHHIQLALDPLRTPSVEWDSAIAKLREAGIGIMSGMMGCVGEDYSTIAAIHRTGGVVPDETWPQSLANFRQAAPIASAAGIKLVTLHAGFIPDDPNSAVFKKVVERIVLIAEIFASQGVNIALETGQERAAALLQFLKTLGTAKVGVNFDPANMLLYGSGDPIEALQLLAPHVRQVHIKDATRSGVPGTWGNEVPVGKGEVDWPKFFAVLGQADYRGHLVIEREAGENRVADLASARAFLAGVAS